MTTSEDRRSADKDAKKEKKKNTLSSKVTCYYFINKVYAVLLRFKVEVTHLVFVDIPHSFFFLNP